MNRGKKTSWIIFLDIPRLTSNIYWVTFLSLALGWNSSTWRFLGLSAKSISGPTNLSFPRYSETSNPTPTSWDGFDDNFSAFLVASFDFLMIHPIFIQCLQLGITRVKFSGLPRNATRFPYDRHFSVSPCYFIMMFRLPTDVWNIPKLKLK